MKNTVAFLAGGLLTVLLQGQTTGGGIPLSERVMVIYDTANEDSHKVAKYYMEKRAIPKQNICKIDTYNEGMWGDDWYDPAVKKPVRACLEKLGKQKILYLVISYGTPWEVDIGTNRQSLDQLLADIWDEYAGAQVMGREAGTQPYFGNAQSQGNVYEPYVPFAKYREQPLAKTIYSVWRLDAATPELSKGLVDKALYAESHGLKGKAYFDIRGAIQGFVDNGYGAGEWDIYRASEFATKAGFDTTLDDKGTEFGTAPSQLRCENAALYAGWYSLQHYNDAFSWLPGAIGFHLDSASATNPHTADNWSGAALLKGITVTSGSVTEPFLEGLVHPDRIFLYLFQGANVGDAVLRGTRWLKWMILNLGDPLYRPFPDGVGPFKSASYRGSWFGITPNEMVGGGTTAGLFMLNGNEGNQITVAAKSTNPDLVTLPGDMTLTGAGKGVRFPIGVKAAKEPTSVTISVKAGNETLTNTLSLYPPLVALTLSQPSMKNDGTAMGTVTLYVPAQGQGVTVKLSSTVEQVNLPSELKIAAGAIKATFPISAKGVKAEVTTTISATIEGISKGAQLKITP
jgi:uncharacterized protein (TIGR03790 family)